MFRRKRPVPAWVMVLALGLLGAALALLLGLLYLLYWMATPVALPEPARLIAEDADFYLVCRPDLKQEAQRAWTAGFFAWALRSGPLVVSKAVGYALSPERTTPCPVQIVASGRCADGRLQSWAAAVSLGRYRGAFWLADREFGRLVRRGEVPYAAQARGDTWFYQRTESGQGPPVLALWRATGLAGSDRAGVGQVYDRLDAESSVPAPQPRSTGEGGPIDTGGAFGRGAFGRGAFGKGLVRRPQAVLPVLERDARPGGPKAEAGGSTRYLMGSGLGPIDVTLSIGGRGMLVVEATSTCPDEAAAREAAEAVRRALEAAKKEGRVASFETGVSERVVRARWEWRAPWQDGK